MGEGVSRRRQSNLYTNANMTHLHYRLQKSGDIGNIVLFTIDNRQILLSFVLHISHLSP